MSFDFNLAQNSTQFVLTHEDYLALINSDLIPHHENEQQKLFSALLSNKKLLRFRVPENFFSPEQTTQLKAHLAKNVRAILHEVEISVLYKDENHKKDFRFDKPDFYQSSEIFFTKFNLKQGVLERDLKLEVLKDFMVDELEKCPNLTRCFVSINEKNPGATFLNEQQVQRLKNIHCKVYQSARFQPTSMLFLISGMAIGLLLFAASIVALPLFGIKSFITLTFASLISIFAGVKSDEWRQRFLCSVGKPYLDELTEGKVPADPSLKQSLVIGEKSKYWGEYFKSYLNLKSYSPQNYRAYAAGLYTGVKDLKVEKEIIRKKAQVH